MTWEEEQKLKKERHFVLLLFLFAALLGVFVALLTNKIYEDSVHPKVQESPSRFENLDTYDLEDLN